MSDIEKAARNIIFHKLNKCTPAQKEIFNRMYKSIDKIPFNKLKWAEQQIDRTIAKNQKG
jgi:hypothetical protein